MVRMTVQYVKTLPIVVQYVKALPVASVLSLFISCYLIVSREETEDKIYQSEL